MKYCPSCGKAGVEGMKFCPQCGQRLTGFDLEEKQRPVRKPEAPLKEKNWFERHLNWTMVLAWVGSYLIVIIVWILAILADPYISDDALIAIYVILYVIIPLIVSIAVGQWVLRKKNRSMWWLLLSSSIFFLFISNKSPIADYDEAIKLEPSNADGYFNRGDAYDEMGEYGKAIGDYSKAIQLNPNYADAYCNRGCAYGEIGDYDKAIADYNKAIELDPNNALAYYNRGLAYHEEGEVPEVVNDLEKCIGLSADPELTKDAQQALRKIKNSP